MKVTVKVTQKDIDKGCAFEANNCPIALALQRALGWRHKLFGRSVRVTRRVATITNPRKWESLYEAALPHEASTFVYNFDHKYGSVKPFTFELTFEKVTV